MTDPDKREPISSSIETLVGPVDWDTKPSAAWATHRSLVETAILQAKLAGKYIDHPAADF